MLSIKKTGQAILYSIALSCPLVFSTVAIAKEVKIVSYNALSGSNWETRMDDVAREVLAHDPDIIAFQEVLPSLRRRGTDDQQSGLEREFSDDKWQFFRWNQEFGHRNCAPIVVNTDRFTVVANGSLILDFTDEITEAQWQDLWDLHDYFHKSHTFVEIRYVTWVVVEDTDGKRYSVMNTHYETYPEAEHGAPEDPVKKAYFEELLHRVFVHMSTKSVEQGEILRQTYNASPILVGDFEYGDLTDPAIKTIVDGGYSDTWLALNVESNKNRRPARGIDHIFASNELTVKEAFYDLDATASDHSPLIAVIDLDGTTITDLGEAEAQTTIIEQGMASAESKWQRFSYTVEEGVSSLNIILQGGEGEAILYLREGESISRKKYDCMATINDHSQECLIENPKPGNWTIGLYKISAYSDKTLTAVTE
ncbi:endonuclease/exonuclease/phosphatase family protein [Colwellia psychrerythraea]|uniref:Endonuclease/exonuclease/phosphatase n=1 Tax=Colwellia psychrerythraea TaxID=28229 RepID=A0A099KQ02_COLPS|nr:endonuclease/exonuclease/phosphatase family protein [Colwellia psychrerythraea]KGJ91703.1 Endonuclease/exonuclease/phosphatase [Colwellia psychrerythraea]